MKNFVLNVSDAAIARRRFKVFGLVILSTVLAAIKWVFVIPSDANWVAQSLMIVLFVLTFAWIALFFWSSVFGFFELLAKKKWKNVDFEISAKTAVLMPVYNESSRDVFANLLAMAEELGQSKFAALFDIFVLSDTTNPKVWVEEEKTWLDAQKLMPKDIDLYYRHRVKNVARKSGNIEDFCNRWGKLYDFMIVLDADSLLEASTMLKMVKFMEVNGDIGIIQAPPLAINRNTLFARLQQFAGKVYGAIVAAGLSYWQGAESNYWGHNAIIRVKAFMECCGLPVLKGKAPFGGQILSHDFVEAALIRRGGWKAWLLPELGGSYEECPPTMIDFAGRDRRWCQGNMQHMKILVSKVLHPISRIHFLTGIMSYLASPLWLCFLLTGLAIALGQEFFPPVYFGEERSLFPDWPTFDKWGTVMLFVVSMAMLIMPKFMGLVIYVKENKSKNIGGFLGAIVSTIIEIAISVLFAPIMMMFQSKFVWDIFTGHSVGWNTQNRGDTGTSWSDALKRHIWHTILGIVTLIVVVLYARELFWWMLPVLVGLIFAIPISVFSSKASWGIALRKINCFVIPEEIKLPEVLKRAKHFLDVLVEAKGGAEILLKDSVMNNLHIMMLGVNGPMPELEAAVVTAAEIKVENYINHGTALDLNADEEKALLYSPLILQRASLAMKLEQA